MEDRGGGCGSDEVRREGFVSGARRRVGGGGGT